MGMKSKAVWINGSLIAGFLIWAAWQFMATDDLPAFLISVAKRAYWAFRAEYFDDMTSPVFYLPFAAVVALEWGMPAIRHRTLAPASTRLDLFYTLVDRPFRLLVMLPYVAYLSYLYHHVLGGPVFHHLSGVPDVLAVGAMFLLADFMGWFHHVLRHKISAVWQFHAVHHSTRFFNIFSRNRIHPIDIIFADQISFLPFLYFHQYLGEVAMLYFFKLCVDLMAHSNVRMNYGPLRYILVTPQSHRIHHSFLPQHRDKNFGVALSIWDYIFGTQYRRYDEYPDIGIEDQAYPEERGHRPLQILKTFAGQMIYPFRVVLGRPLPKPVPAATA